MDDQLTLHFHGFIVCLQSADPQLRAFWRNLYGDWLQTDSGQTPHLMLTCQRVTQLPPLPDHPPYFHDQRDNAYEAASLAVAYQLPSARLLYFFDGIFLTIPTESSQFSMVYTENALKVGRVEDGLISALGAFLRRDDLYLIHASSAAWCDQGVLFVGESGSGKTTTCLNLILHGGQLLANDISLLQKRGDQFYLLAVPDTITIRPKTRQLLPQLQQYTQSAVPARQLVANQWAEPTLLTAIFFPQITSAETTRAAPLNRAIALAQLLQQSADGWDIPALPAHTEAFAQLVGRTPCYTLLLGHDLSQQRALIAQLLPA